MNQCILKELKQIHSLIKKGWCRRDYERTINGNTHYCLSGAIK